MIFVVASARAPGRSAAGRPRSRGSAAKHVGTRGHWCPRWQWTLAAVFVVLFLQYLLAGRNLEGNPGGRRGTKCRDLTRAADQEGPVHLHKRGAAAWVEDPRDHAPLRGGRGVNRLHAHAVVDDVAVVYANAARGFLDWAEEHHALLTPVLNLDGSLADYVADLAYGRRRGLQYGRCAVFGVEAIWPQYGGSLPQSRRALAAWDKLTVQGEGGPIPWAGVGAIAHQLEAHGEYLAAELVLISADMYLRESDWDLMRSDDIIDAGSAGIAVHLGRAERGESAKTGIRQGVRPDRAGVAALLRARKAATLPGRKCYPISKAAYRTVFDRACRALDYDAGPPHALRHTGPSYDLLEGYRTIDQVRVRGRWRAKTSVLRYGKTHILLAAESLLPPNVRALGDRRLGALGARPASAPA